MRRADPLGKGRRMATARHVLLRLSVMTMTRTILIIVAILVGGMLACRGPCPDCEGAGDDKGTEDTGKPDEPLEPACQFKWEWRQRIDDIITHPQPDVWGVDVDKAGNVYAVGSVAETDPPGKMDIWVARWTPD